MKKLFDWIIEQTPQYKNLKYANEINYENAKTYYREKKELEENYNFLVDETAEQIKKFIKVIKKIRTHVNKLDKKDENVKEIKKLIKEVL